MPFLQCCYIWIFIMLITIFIHNVGYYFYSLFFYHQYLKDQLYAQVSSLNLYQSISFFGLTVDSPAIWMSQMYIYNLRSGPRLSLQVSLQLLSIFYFFCLAFIYYWSIVDLQFLLISALQQSDSVIYTYAIHSFLYPFLLYFTIGY